MYADHTPCSACGSEVERSGRNRTYATSTSAGRARVREVAGTSFGTSGYVVSDV